MRPSFLDPFFMPISSLSGIGAKVCALIAKITATPVAQDEPRIVDLVSIMPHSVVDRRQRPGIAFATPGEIATFEIVIDNHRPAPRTRKNMPYRVVGHDDSAEITLNFFHAHVRWLERQLPPGKKVIVSGRMELFNGRATMVHPDHIAQENDQQSLVLIEPVYPLTAGLSGKTLHKAIIKSLDIIPDLPEWIEPSIADQQGFPSYKSALKRMHLPNDPSAISLESVERQRLAYDELLAGQLALGLVRAKTRKIHGRSLPKSGQYVEDLKQCLPFQLTAGQEHAFAEISADLAAHERMLRLLQGDVGSGKTVVALMAMLQAAESHGQSAFMAPTEILARQHYHTMKPLIDRLGLKVVVLTAREKGKLRQTLLESIKNGEVDIVIGTHALIQNNIEFKDLALVIIDEQHRFGVEQRLQLTAKGAVPDLLVMTATPIPRTLVLTAFGDMDVSRLTEKPIGRKPIITATLSDERMGELLQRIAVALQQDKKIYWICPLVEESEIMELTAASDRFEELQKLFGQRVGIVHGRMGSDDKDAAMLAFKNGETRLLVATSVIEVGVDVPDASIIIIEHAERFGLAQLHQLRGRVGRGEQQSSCILLYKAPLSKIAQSRLNVMRKTEDGFYIAEEDLRLRGEGELLGKKQSGVPEFKIADLTVHSELLALARKNTQLILQQDSELMSKQGKALRNLLYLFRRDDAIRLLRAG